jgi:hypothetical protein
MSLVLLAGGSNPGLAEAVAGPLGLPLADREASRFSDRVPEFDERIDYVFARGFGQRNREVLGQVTVRAFGPPIVSPGRSARSGFPTTRGWS